MVEAEELTRCVDVGDETPMGNLIYGCSGVLLDAPSLFQGTFRTLIYMQGTFSLCAYRGGECR